MDFEQLRIERREMEDSIHVAVLEAMRAFRMKTGICPQSIDIQLTSIDERKARFVVGKVRACVLL